jgi:hypothetical protein
MPTRRSPRSDRALRASVASVLVVATGATLACGKSHFETALAVPTTPRQPDGVLVEPPPVLPEAEDRGSASSAVVSLRPPMSDEQITSVVKAYVRALEDAAIEPMMQLFLSEAALMNVAQGTPRQTVRQYFNERFHPQGGRGPNPFAGLRGLIVPQLEKLERWDYRELSRTTEPVRPQEMRDGDLLVRLPITAPLGPMGEHLVGDFLYLLFRRDQDAKKVGLAGVAETNLN